MTGELHIFLNFTVHPLETLRDREQSEFKEIKAHLRVQLSLHDQQEKELEGKIREIQGNCREKETMINMLTPQNAEVRTTFFTTGYYRYLFYGSQRNVLNDNIILYKTTALYKIGINSKN